MWLQHSLLRRAIVTGLIAGASCWASEPLDAAGNPTASLPAGTAPVRTIWSNLPDISPWRQAHWSATHNRQPRKLAELAELINQANQQGARRVVIPPGVYHADAEPGVFTTLLLEDINDLEIVAEQATIISHSTKPVLVIKRATNLTIRGLTIDIGLDAFHFTQGTVRAVHPRNAWLEVELHAAYPDLPLGLTTVRKTAVYEPTSLLLKTNIHTMLNKSVAPAGPPRRYRLMKPFPGAVVGDYITFVPQAGGHAVTAIQCNALTLEDLTIHASHMFSVIDMAGLGNTYRRIRITPGPMPDDAVVPRLKSSAQDAIHFKSMRGNMLVEDCLIECHSDDAVAANTAYNIVLRAEPDKLVFSAKHTTYVAGETVCLTRPDTMQPLFSAELSNLQRVTDAEQLAALATIEAEVMPKVFERHKQDRQLWQATLQAANAAVPALQPGDLISSLACNRGLIVQRNFVRNARARGFMLKCSDLIIRDNVMTHTQDFAVNLSPEVYWLEAGHPHNVLIENNIFRSIGFSPAKHGGVITIKATGPAGDAPAGAFQNIRIIGNTIEHYYKTPIWITSSQAVEIRGNTFRAPQINSDSLVISKACRDLYSDIDAAAQPIP